VLIERMERVLLWQACGEGSTTDLEINLILDELRHLRAVMGALYEEAANLTRDQTSMSRNAWQRRERH
jgi:hypothetical protein